MALNNKSFAENLERLMYLVGMSRENKYSKKNIWLSNAILSNFEAIVDNYYKLSSEIPEHTLGKIGEPIQQIMEQLIAQLIRELGKSFDTVESFDNLEEDIYEIDFLLKDPFLSNDEINELLDRRSKLQELLNNKHLN